MLLISLMKNKVIQGQVIPINQSNIDTDAIIPKQYLKSINKSGFGPYLFDSLRYMDPGDLATTSKRKENPDFILNKKPFRNGSIIVANENFGCGSSREHAVWALKDYGIQAVISSSFADIFYRNSFKNSLLLIIIKKSELETIFRSLTTNPIYNLTIDVQNQTITTPDETCIKFDISDSDKERIIFDLDDIELSLKHADKIRDYESKIKLKKPWLFNKNNE
tara:strand:- start:619 stop:1281 length:663 start_codon:yes stop_codon:yes gene_type:complete